MHPTYKLFKARYKVYKPSSIAKNAVDKNNVDPPTLILMDLEPGKERNEIAAIEEISTINYVPINFIAGILEENLQIKQKSPRL